MHTDVRTEKQRKITDLLAANLPLIGLVVIVIVFQILTGGLLLTDRNIQSLIDQTYLLMIGCIGSIFLFLQGGVDLSMTSGIGTCAIMGAFALNAYGLGACIAAMLVTGLILGLFNGVIYAYTKINPFILSLSVNLVLDGLNYTFTDQLAVIQIARAYQRSFRGMEFKIGVLVVFALLVFYIYRFTVIGKYSRAIGAGEIASRQSGVRVRQIKILAFVFTGITCALYGFMTMMKSAGGGPASGLNVGFNVMMAMILGGSSMEGGLAAKFKSAIIGALIVTVLTNALSMLGIQAMLQEVIRGVIFVVVVVLTTRFKDKIEGNRYVVRKAAKKVA